jgi:hypothetical protein
MTKEPLYRAALALALTLTLWTGTAQAQRPTEPSEVRPLLVGTEAPVTEGVIDTDGKPFDLHAAIVDKPTVLVFYRGHW